MLLSSASIRTVLVISLLLTLSSCAAAPPDYGTPLPGTVAGTIQVSGSHPYERQLVLAGEDGLYWFLRSRALEAELLLLDGQAVRVHGILGSSSSGPPELSVEYYELLALPGSIAVVGTLGSYQGTLVLRCDTGVGEAASIDVFIDGPLREPLEHFIGYRIWISGEQVVAAMVDGSDYETIGADGGFADSSASVIGSEQLQVIVSEYGVLGPPMSSLRDVPHSIYPDSCR